jgi:hypothetical protein
VATGVENQRFSFEQSLEEMIQSARWIYAKTYHEIAPHWYIRKWQHKTMVKQIKDKIKTEGVNEQYTNHKGTTYTCRYWYHNDYKYWYMDPVLNRAKTKEVSNGKT